MEPMDYNTAGTDREREKILIVDDDVEIVNLLEIYMNNSGYETVKCYDGDTALQVIDRMHIDLAILDIMLQGKDGFQLCREIRKNYIFPIIMLTAKSEEADLVTGMSLGADDYITKPFKGMEVVARVKAQLRRYKKYDRAAAAEIPEERELEIRGLRICGKTHKAYLYDREISLTPIEFSIIQYLFLHRGKVVSSEELFAAVWDTPFINGNKTIMTHIGRLREKLGENTRNPRFIKTVWGVGYTVE